MQPLLPRDVRKALRLLDADCARERSVGELAAACGVGLRTLQKHFRRFLGRTPLQVHLGLRMERARRDLLCCPPGASVTAIALRWGFGHLGRFAMLYSNRYGESPSATLRHRRSADAVPLPIFQFTANRPLVGVLPFAFVGAAAREAALITDDIIAALCRKRGVAVGPPSSARYRVRGSVQASADGRLRATVMLADTSNDRYIWADQWDGDLADCFAFQDRVAAGVASSIERSVREAETALAIRRNPAGLDAWGLTMRALPHALSRSGVSIRDGRVVESRPCQRTDDDREQGGVFPPLPSGDGTGVRRRLRR